MLQWMQESLLPGLLEPYQKAIPGSYCNSVVNKRLLKLIYVKNDDSLPSGKQ